MKRFNRNQTKTNQVGASKIRLSFLCNRTRKHYSKAGAAILAIIILHFVSQFIFLQNENHESEIVSAKIEDKRNNKQINNQTGEQNVEMKTKYGAKNSGVIEMPAPPAAPSTVRRKLETVPSRTVIKKKEPRESRTERLRRAERILTGI